MPSGAGPALAWPLGARRLRHNFESVASISPPSADARPAAPRHGATARRRARAGAHPWPNPGRGTTASACASVSVTRPAARKAASHLARVHAAFGGVLGGLGSRLRAEGGARGRAGRIAADVPAVPSPGISRAQQRPLPCGRRAGHRGRQLAPSRVTRPHAGSPRSLTGTEKRQMGSGERGAAGARGPPVCSLGRRRVGSAMWGCPPR